jgi:hypothetical protein
MNRDALGSAQPTPLAEDRFSRFSPVHRADFEGQQRADSAPTAVATGKTGMRAEAAIPLRARNGLHRPKHAYAKRFVSACASAISGDGEKSSQRQ